MKFLFLIQLLFLSVAFSQSLYINEFMASNSNTIRDPDFNNYADWIEIYNSGTNAVNLKNYYITDNLSQPQKFRFNIDFIVPANGYVLVWADDANTGNHTNFKLSATGESIGLFNPSLQLIDTISFGSQETDISFGRFPNGTTNWYKFNPSTPGSANLESGIFNILPQPNISHQSGFYSSTIFITISHNQSNVTIRYTLNGSTPSNSSNIYSTPIQIDSTIVLRVRVFKDGYLPSKTLSRTFLISENTQLPVFSLITDPENFFSDTSGIYVAGTNGIIGNCSTVPRNWNQDWERPAHLEFFENNKSLAFKVDCGVKIFGGCSRLYPMKSLAFYFRSQYGFDKLNYRLFDDSPITEFNNFILRSSGQDWYRTMYRDAMVQTLIEQGMKLDYQNYRPTILFINGKYWGIHNLREKLNEHYVFYHHGVNKDNIDLIEISKNIQATNGDITDYNYLINFLTQRNMAYTPNYEHIKTFVDIDQYIDYQIAQIYSANGDWPGSNVKLWKEKVPGAKWRWMIYDLDFTFGGNAKGMANTNTLEQATATNGPDWPNPPWSTLMFRKLLDNPEFKNEFIQRFAAHMNTTFEPNRVLFVIDSMAQKIASEIPKHKQRWPQSISYAATWQELINVMKTFTVERPANVRNHFYTKFGISGVNNLILSRNNPQWGKIFINTVEIKNNVSTNTFFRNIPIRVKALAMPGYRFVRWEGISNQTSPEIVIQLNANSTLTAIFEPEPLTYSSIIINEINYKSSPLFDTEDWLEFYNPSDNSIDISGWKLHDDNISNQFIFPNGTIVGAKSYLVVCRDSTKFKSLNPSVLNRIGNINFGLSSDGDQIFLKDNSNTTIDEIQYSVSLPWPSAPNGSGATLSLINPQLDNSLPENWKASRFAGTPGKLNDVYTEIEENDNTLPTDFILYQNFPNPFNPTTKIRWQSPVTSWQTLKVFDALGREVITLVDEFREAGNYEIDFNAEELSSGIYFYQLRSGKFVQTKKMILMR